MWTPSSEDPSPPCGIEQREEGGKKEETQAVEKGL